MKNRASLSLMELVMMLLVFAIAGAFCLQVFVQADALSRQARQRDDAILLAQTAAETLKQCAGGFDAASQILGGRWDGGSLQAEKDGLQLLAVPETTELSTLGGATVRVLASDGSLLAELPVFWQEVTHGT